MMKQKDKDVQNEVDKIREIINKRYIIPRCEHELIEYKYGFREMFAIKCCECGKRRTLKEFLLTPLGLCDNCDIKWKPVINAIKDLSP